LAGYARVVAIRANAPTFFAGADGEVKAGYGFPRLDT